METNHKFPKTKVMFVKLCHLLQPIKQINVTVFNETLCFLF